MDVVGRVDRYHLGPALPSGDTDRAPDDKRHLSLDRVDRRRWNTSVTAETPAGDRYMVATAPPGSAPDAGTGQTRGGLLGALLTVLTVVTRSMRRGWRVAVTP